MFIIHINAVVDAVRLPEIEWRAIYREKFVGAEMGVVLHAGVSVHLKKMIHNIATLVTLEIEVGVVREVHHSRRVGCSLVFGLHDIIICQPISYPSIHISGIAFFAVRTESMETDSGASLFLHRF